MSPTEANQQPPSLLPAPDPEQALESLAAEDGNNLPPGVSDRRYLDRAGAGQYC